MKEYFIAGVLVCVGGCIGALLVNELVNESWYKRMIELNNAWADFAKQQNRDWANFAHELGSEIANDILREEKNNASADVHDGGSGSEVASDQVSA